MSIWFVSVLASVCTVVYGQLNSCTQFFSYKNNGGETVGYITIPANFGQFSYRIELKSSVGVKLDSNYYGKIEPIEKTWQQSCAALQKGYLHFIVRFPTQNPVPTVENIEVNKNVICTGPRATGNYVTSFFLSYNLKLDCPNNFSPPTSANFHDQLVTQDKPLFQNQQSFLNEQHNFNQNQNFQHQQQNLNQQQNFQHQQPNFIQQQNFQQQQQNYNQRPNFDYQNVQTTKPPKRPNRPILDTLVNIFQNNKHPSNDYDSLGDPELPRPIRPFVNKVISGKLKTLFDNNEICGKPVRESTPLIVNGQRSKRGAYPWLTAIYFEDLFTCGGNLVSDRHIVTAAHCITEKESYDPKKYEVVMGLYALEDSFGPEAVSRVPQKLHVHPHYQTYSEDKADGDIAIIVFKAITFTTYIKPICLFETIPDLSNVVGRIGRIAGWGTDENGRNVSREVRDTEVRLVSKEICTKVDELKPLVTDRTFCASGRSGSGSGPCSGDSGGGLFIPIDDEKRDQWYLRGIISSSLRDPFSKSQCDTSNYAVYTDIAKYLTWVKEFAR